MSNPRPNTSQLPAEADLRHLRDQAKDLLKSGEAPTLAVALFDVARRYGFPSWPKLRLHVISLTNAGKLKQAIDQNDLPAIQKLLTTHEDLKASQIGYGGAGPLTWAAECRGMGQPSPVRLSIVDWLIKNGCDVHEGGNAPLMRASLNGSRISMMELLVNAGADVNAAWHGVYPIIFAPCETLDEHALAWLLRHGADPNCGDESTWRSRGHAHPGTALDYLLGTYLRSKEDLNGCIPLLKAAGGLSRHDEPGVFATIQGDSALLQKLIEEDRSLIDKRFPSLDIGTTAQRMLTLRGGTLLHVACEFGRLEVAIMLLDSGAGVDAAAQIGSDGLGGQSPIFHAATQNADFGLDIVRLLISRGADLSLRCRVPGHYELPNDVFEGTVLEYARRFPGTDSLTLRELTRTAGDRSND
jgi:ankyrin repeat protein